MKIGLVVEENKGEYIKGILDTLKLNNIFITSSIVVTNINLNYNSNIYTPVINAITGYIEYIKNNHLPKKTRLFFYKNHKYVFKKNIIPIKKYLELEYDKIIVILNKKNSIHKSNKLLNKMLYKHYPNLQETINKLYKDYYNNITLINSLSNESRIFVIKQDSHNKGNLYNNAQEDINNNLDNLKKYLSL